MPTTDQIALWLPRAIDRGRGSIMTRPYTLDMWARRDNGFRLVNVEKISYNPRWLQIVAYIVQSGIEKLRVYGSEGVIPLDYSVTDNEPILLTLENLSIDSEAKMTIFARGWRTGEG